MNTMLKVSFATKLLSNNHYLSEVAIENRKCSRFYRQLYLYDQFVRLLIRSGNCITLLSNPISITADSFWNILQFEEIAKYVFWTFSKSFLLMVTDNTQSLSAAVAQRCLELLETYPTAFNEQVVQDADEEVLWCLRKNSNLQKDVRYELMYRLDWENRAAVLNKLQEVRRLNQRDNGYTELLLIASADPTAKPSTKEKETSVTFLNLLKPMQKSSMTTLNFVRDSLTASEFTFDLFSPVAKVSNGKNPHGLNGQIAAMIDFFFQHNYFIAGVDQRQIFTAYFQFSGNSIPKLGHYYAQFRADTSYIRYFEKLKALKISKL